MLCQQRNCGSNIENFEKLQSELTVVKQVNSALSEKGQSPWITQCLANGQYSRGERLDLMGVPRSISNSDLEEKVLKIFEKVGCPIMGNNIEACYRISKKMKGEVFSLKGLPKCT